MTASASSAPGSVTLQHQLTEQLQALSLVGETITLRLLELEERMAAIEQQVSALQGRDNADPGDEANAMLAATEERIARLEELLEEQTPLPGRPRQASLHSLPLAQGSEPIPDPELELNPFPEDEEQPFMDELSA